MAQLLLFEPRKGHEEAYMKQLETFKRWATEGMITWKQFQNYRRQLEYALIMRNRREAR